MKYDDFKLRIYNTETNEYIIGDAVFEALLCPKEYYNIELLSDLKTTENEDLYDNDVIKIVFSKGNKIINTFYSIVNMRQDRDWEILVISRDRLMGIGLQHFKILKDYPKENASYDTCEISKIGVFHDVSTAEFLKEKEHRIFKEISKEFKNL